MLEFILFVLRNRCFSNPDPTVDTGRRSRHLMSKIISKSPVMPRSLFITSLTMPGSGTCGLVYKGEHEGRAVDAIKVLCKTLNNVVRHALAGPLKPLFSISFQKQEFCREVLMWRSLHHKFILPFLGIYENEASSQFFLVSPYMANGTLAQWRKRVVPSVLEIEMHVRFILFLSFLYRILTCCAYYKAPGSRSGHQLHSFRRRSSR